MGSGGGAEFTEDRVNQWLGVYQANLLYAQERGRGEDRRIDGGTAANADRTMDGSRDASALTCNDRGGRRHGKKCRRRPATMGRKKRSRAVNPSAICIALTIPDAGWSPYAV
ncbi:hypothetical protein GCM10009525_30000 [Streptosporangium amethystogenes subsp. fukuiense]